MAEIKTTFTKGRMNKDLDERLVPKGEYRHAVNVEVSTSEGSNVGTVQNIVGNSRIESVVPSGHICIGSVADEANNKLYWLTSSDDKDIIYEHDVDRDQTSLVFVDLNKTSAEACLKFGNKIITGLNVLDNFLLFTDGENEPKKINIKRSKIGTVDVNTHTVLIRNENDVISNNLGPVREEDITVIKKRPTTPLIFKINKSSSNKEKGIFEKTFPRFSYRYKYSDNEYSAFGPFTTPVFSADYTDDFNSINFYNKKEGFNTAMLNTIESIELTGLVKPSTPRGVVSVDILFKREDSNVVYSVETLSIEEINETENIDQSRGSYTVTTENIFAAINENQILRPFDNVPKTALAQEVVGNRIVYGNYTQGYDVGRVKVDSNYEVRNLQNKTFSSGGLESLKAQRDYQVGVVFGDKYGRETPVFTSDEGSVIVPWSNSNVADGPSYLSSLILNSSVTTPAPTWADYYKFYVKETSGEYYNLLMDRVYLPSSSTDYENEEDHVYLAFDSADINKIQEDTYLILKKTSSPNEKYISDLNRYKVLDVSATVPDAIAYVYLPVGEVSNNDDDTNLANGAAEGSLFQNSDFRIDKQTDVVEIDKSSWFEFGYPVLRGTGTPGNSGVDNTEFIDNIYISWKKVEASGLVTHSKRYKAVSIEIAAGMRLKLEEEISFEDSELAKGSSDTVLDADLVFEVFRKEKRDGQNFSGKFFVKVISDDILKNNILGQETNISNARFVTASNDLFWWADGLSSDSYDNIGVNGQFFNNYATNPESQPTSLTEITGSTNTFEEWDALISETAYFKKMFIDNMYMTSSSLSEDGYAKNTGQGVIGSGITYPKIEWNSENIENWDIDGDSSWSVSDTSTDSWTDDIVNGMSGIIEVSDDYIEGPGAWKKDIHTNEADTIYGEEEGGYFMHVSFFAPGKDLHDGDFGGSNDLANVDINGENSIASLLKGIWGGGAFTKEDGSGFGDLNTGLVEFEGNYLGEDALGEAPAPGVGKGYDLEYKEYHDRQWDPTFSPKKRSFGSVSEPDKDLEDFIKNLTIGSKFKFKDDTSAEVYTIIDVSVKHIYNHTPWRSMYINDSLNGIVRGGNSVEEAAVLWATAKQNGNDQVVSSETNNVTPAQNLINKINQFGQASNRRTCYILRLDKNPASGDYDYNPVAGGSNNVDLDTSTKIQFIDANAQASSDLTKNVSAVFETEPKDSLDLNIFYEASQAIPTFLTLANANDFAPVGTRIEMVALPQALRGQNIVTDNILVSGWEETADGRLLFNVINENSLQDYTLTEQSIDENGSEVNVTRIDFESYNEDLASGNVDRAFNYQNSNSIVINYANVRVRFYRPDGSYTSCRLLDNDDNLNNNPDAHGNRYAFVVDKNIDLSLSVGIDWFNCYSFGNGVESNRIKDDFNMPFISNGARVSTTIEEPYPFEEKRKYGLIYSGLYNGSSGLNNLNQFIQAEKITKDLNPTYGSIQKLFTRRSDLIAFCEDRVVKILANKDALFNADGNANLVATENVLGQASPFVGEFGISKNPESFAKESYRAYFTDRSRGAVLRLSMDGITPISEAGMHDYFRDTIPLAGTLLGTYDDYKKQYNITLDKARYNNILFNSYITEGELLNMSDATFQLIGNGDLDSGEDYIDLSGPGGLDFLYQNDETSPVLNETFSGETMIINWPGIPKGQMSSYYDNTITEYASLTYTQVVQNYGTIGYVTQAQHGSTATEDSVYNYDVDAPAVQGVFPTYNFGGYIARNEHGSSGFTADPFSTSGYDQYHGNAQYYTSTPTTSIYQEIPAQAVLSNHQPQLNYPINGILMAIGSDTVISNFYFPYTVKAAGSDTFYGNNTTTEGANAWSTLYPPTAAQQEISGNLAYQRSVYNGEIINVKLQYRLRKRWQYDASNWHEDWGKITVQLCDYTMSVASNIVSNILSTDEYTTQSGVGVSSSGEAYVGPDHPSAVGFDPWDYHAVNNESGVGTGWQSDALGTYEGYTLLSGVYNNVIINDGIYDDNVAIGNVKSDNCTCTIVTNPRELDPGSNIYYHSGSATDTALRDDLWNHDDTVNYDDQGYHQDRYSKIRTVVVQFRLFDKADPWTPKRLVAGLNAKIIAQGNTGSGVLVTGVAMWKTKALETTGNLYIPEGATQISTPFQSSAVYGLISEEQTTQTLTDTAQTVGDAAATYSSFDNLNVTAGTPGSTGALNVATFTQTSVSNANFVAQGVVGTIEQPNENTPGFDPSYGDNGGIPPWAEVVHFVAPEYYSAYNNNYANLIAQQEELYGSANAGSWQSYTYGQDGAQTGYYRIGSSNGVVEYNQYTGTALTEYDGQSNIEFGPQAGATKVFAVVGQGQIDVSTDGLSEDCGFVYTHPEGEILFELGKWYVVDLEYEGEISLGTQDISNSDNTITAPITTVNGGTVWLRGCLDNGIAVSCHGQTQDSNIQDSLYPDGAFGMVYSRSSDSSLVMLPTVATEYGSGNRTVLRAVFKATESSFLYTDHAFQKVDIRCYSIDNTISFKSLTVINITDQNTSGAFSDSNWSAQIPPNTVNALQSPNSYYSNGSWVWNSPHPATWQEAFEQFSNQIKYSFSNELDSLGSQDYTVQYTIANGPDGNVKGKYYIVLDTPQQENGLFYRIGVEGDLGDVVSAGIHEFTVNFLTGQITETISNGATINVNSSENFFPLFGAETNTVLITGQSLGNGFSMALDSFFMYTGSTAQSGGNIDGWTFYQSQYNLGVNEGPIVPITTDNFVTFENINNNTQVYFNNAPFGTMMTQHIEEEVLFNQAWKVQFKASGAAFPFEIYYFTPNSVSGNATGFRINLTDGLGSGQYSYYNYQYILPQFGYSYGQMSVFGIIQNMSNDFNPDVDIVGSLVIKIVPWSFLPYTSPNGVEVSLTEQNVLDSGATLESFYGTIDNITFTQQAPTFQGDTFGIGKPITVSYSEDVKGWVSFKTFYSTNNVYLGPESGLSVSTKYFTFNRGYLYEHYRSNSYNSFYGNLNQSEVEVILNDGPGTVKDFKTLNYEGSQARYLLPSGGGDPLATDATEFVQNSSSGWYAYNVVTDLSKGKVLEFVKKENKWYNYIKGNDTLLESLGNLHVQGLGLAQGPPELMPDVFNVNDLFNLE